MVGASPRELFFLHSPVPAVVVDVGACVVDANDAYVALTRRTRDALIGAFSIDFIHADDLPRALAGLAELERGAPSVRQHRRHLRGDGTWVQLDTITAPIPSGDDRLLLIQVLHCSEAVEVEEDDEATARLLLQPSGDASCFHDASGRIAFATRNLAQPLGRTVEWLYRRRLTDPELHPVDVDGRPIGPTDDPVVVALRTGTDVVTTIGLLAASGERLWFSVRTGPAVSGRLPARSHLRDVTELVRAQEHARQLAGIVERELTHRADHDSLTGLKARHAIVRAIEGHLVDGGSATVVFVDLDGFKAVNDAHGHLAGDDALVAVAHALRRLCPPGATVGRSGGDEFVGVFGDELAAQGFATEVGRLTLTEPPFEPIRASVGVASSRPGESARDVLRRADAAMYAAKRAGGQRSTRR